MTELTLSCVVEGDTTAFSVDIMLTKSVDRLKQLICTPARFPNITPERLTLWRADILLANAKKDVTLLQSVISNTPSLKEDAEISAVFPLPEGAPNGMLHIIVRRPQQGLKRNRGHDDDEIPHLKRFNPNSTVNMAMRRFVYYADQTESNEPLVEKIRRGEFVRVYGDRASGKSSRIVDAMDTLKNDYECIYVDFQSINVTSEDRFWMSLSLYFKSFGFKLDFKDSSGFREAFSTIQERWTRPVIIFFDEFDTLHQVTAIDACSSMLSAFRDIRNDPSRGTEKPKHVIHSVVSIGTYGILQLNQLNQTNSGLSPFNSGDNFQNKSLSLDQVRELYREFAEDRGRTIDGRVIEDIFLQSNGHAALVNICGVALDAGFKSLPNGQQADMDHWRSVKSNILSAMERYGTFQRLVRDLIGKSDSQVSALAFYRSHFLGNTSEMAVCVNGLSDRNIAGYLAALGVLHPVLGNKFKIASPLVDSLIRETIIPYAYPDAPNTLSPVRSDGSLDISEVIKSALHFFDKELISRAGRLLYKISPVRVDNSRDQLVPRESVYDSEMTRIFMNWLSSQNGYHVGCQNQVGNLSCDIVLRIGNLHSVALELVATETLLQVQQHIERTVNYKNPIGANEGCVIHFTRQDNYLQTPHWPADEILDGGITMIHIWHEETY